MGDTCRDRAHVHRQHTVESFERARFLESGAAHHAGVQHGDIEAAPPVECCSHHVHGHLLVGHVATHHLDGCLGRYRVGQPAEVGARQVDGDHGTGAGREQFDTRPTDP